MWERASSVQGWYNRDEANLLFYATRGPWIEIGSWKGRSTAVLAQTGYPGYAIDTFTGSSEHGQVDTYDEFLAHMEGLGDVTVLRQDYRDAHELVLSGARMLHIDHEHTYEDTKLAFDLYSPLLAHDAKIAIHDAWTHSSREPDECPWPEVTRFALELLEHPDWTLWDECSRLAVFARR
jgi:hypothetical protein